MVIRGISLTGLLLIHFPKSLRGGVRVSQHIGDSGRILITLFEDDWVKVEKVVGELKNLATGL